ncbi:MULTISPECIES: hypothetical protein [Galbibacter]|uniref:Uncharacterized protein n=1 Tax=Galbibacter orientalis DSM 19592 TaxID=926559 RepID=I3C660_9FLAO|nr:hypothetical protein [Galbibacter orientalis]EIJ39103.1 hypothetical protein JoomaDRAFT_2109 [Galbibacter orientalis DSM 19592]|tara:strand:+ start:27 stop:509 length:483 start_codon:yes stop_codon:yes gene_type:complete
MKIVSTSAKGNFNLIVQNNTITELKYSNWFSENATATLHSHTITLKPKNIWTSRINIFKNEEAIGDITFNLKGYIIIKLTNNEEEINYILKNNSLWKLKFEVFNASNELQFSLKSENKWTKLNYDYEIEEINFDQQTNFEELALYCGYAANLYLAIISAV